LVELKYSIPWLKRPVLCSKKYEEKQTDIFNNKKWTNITEYLSSNN